MKNTESLLITQAEPNDIITIANSWSEIDNYAQPRPFGGNNVAMKKEKIKEIIHQTMTSENAYLLKACIDNEIVGTISGYVYQHPTAKLSTVGTLYSLWVKNNLRQQGIGKSLLESIEQKLGARGAKALQVGWDTLNHRASEWWKARGYIPYETIASKIINNDADKTNTNEQTVL